MPEYPSVAAARRESIMRALRSTDFPMTVADLVRAMEARGEGHLLPWHGKADRVHDALVVLHRRGHVAREGRPAQWSARSDA